MRGRFLGVPIVRILVFGVYVEAPLFWVIARCLRRQDKPCISKLRNTSPQPPAVVPKAAPQRVQGLGFRVQGSGFRV